MTSFKIPGLEIESYSADNAQNEKEHEESLTYDREVGGAEEVHLEEVAPSFDQAMQNMINWLRSRKAKNNLKPEGETTAEPAAVTAKREKITLAEAGSIDNYLEQQAKNETHDFLDYLAGSPIDDELLAKVQAAQQEKESNK